MASLLDQEIVTQDVRLPATGSDMSGAYALVDIAIPDGKQVTGSGVLVTEVTSGGSLAAVDSVPVGTAMPQAGFVSWACGPHPTDSSKWRFELDDHDDAGNNNPVQVRVWIAVVGCPA